MVNWRNTPPSPLPHVLCFAQIDNILYNIHRQKYLPLIVNQFRGVFAILKSTMHYLVVPESNRAGGERDVSVRLLIQFPTDFFLTQQNYSAHRMVTVQEVDFKSTIVDGSEQHLLKCLANN